MSDSKIDPKVTERRGFLLAELLFDDLGAKFVAQPDSENIPFDLLVGFPNSDGGVNALAVEIKALSKPVNGRFQLRVQSARAIANSNIPAILLVIDTKFNRLWYARGEEIAAQIRGLSNDKTISIELRELNEAEKLLLKAELTRTVRAASA